MWTFLVNVASALICLFLSVTLLDWEAKFCDDINVGVIISILAYAWGAVSVLLFLMCAGRLFLRIKTGYWNRLGINFIDIIS